MTEQLLAPTNWIIAMVETLLVEENFNEMQRKFLNNIAERSRDFRDLLLTIPNLSAEKTHEVLSYDGRSQLSSIIEYSEELLDEVEGELSDDGRDLLFEVRSSAQQLLTELLSLIAK